MIITKISNPTICDVVGCNKNAIFCITTNSYKGNSFYCKNCFKNLQSLFKRIKDSNENS